VPFRDITGHDRTFARLTRSIASGSLPPALIFSGVAGIGKRRAALALAQTLNCPTPVHDVQRAEPRSRGMLSFDAHDGDSRGGPAPVSLAIDACGECASCRRIARRVHPDIIVIEPAEDTGNIRVEDVRALNDRINYRPFEGRWRVVVIDVADAMLDQAQNALLKTLEEPPSSSVFTLITARPDDLLPTVRSRCPRIRFAPLTIAEVAAILEREHGVDPTGAQALAAVAGGSVGVALETASASLANARAAAERLLAHLARPGDARSRLLAAGEIVGKSPKGSAAGERESLATHLRAVHALLRDVGVLSAGREPAVANVDLKPALAGLVPAFDRGRLVRAFAAIDQALDALARNASPKIVADWVVLQI
jgi:DNA polymerase-3 subunit delta'